METLYFSNNLFHTGNNVSITRESIRLQFTKIGFLDGLYYLLSSDYKSGYVLDKSSLDELILKNELTALRTDRFNRKLDIPEELINKHCILFMNKVLFSSDSYDEVIKAKEERFENLDVIMYHPK